MQSLEYSQFSTRLKHESNGDNAFVLTATPSDTNQPSLAVFAVADGVSACGVEGAPRASATALQVIRRHLAPLFVDLEALAMMNPAQRKDYFFPLMKQAILAADRVLWNDPEERRCTVSLAVLFNYDLYCANVGDSPIFRIHLRKRRLQACFECHNKAAQLIKNGDITPKQAQKHEGKYRLLYSLGGYSYPERRQLKDADIFTTSVRFTDSHVLLLGSDGALDVFPTKKLLRIAKARRSADRIRRRIFKAVLRRRSHDDFTLIVARYRSHS